MRSSRAVLVAGVTLAFAAGFLAYLANDFGPTEPTTTQHVRDAVGANVRTDEDSTAPADRTSNGDPGGSTKTGLGDPSSLQTRSVDTPTASLSFRILGADGGAQAEVSARWSPTDQPGDGYYVDSIDDHVASLASAAPSTVSDSHGLVSFDDEPAGLAPRSVIWLTHPCHFAHPCFVVGRPPATEPEVRLEAASASSVRVVDLAGTPVTGAIVLVRGAPSRLLPRWDRSPTRPPSVTAEADAAAALFWAVCETDTDGQARVPPFRTPLVATAFHGDRRSGNVLVDSPGAGATLVLASGFLLSGVVHFPAGEPVTDDGRIELLAQGDKERRSLGWLSLSTDGRFGPVQLPAVDLPSLIVRFSGGGWQAVEDTRAMPAPGDHARVELSPSRGVPLNVRLVADERDGEPIASAKATVLWQSDGRWQRAVGWTDDLGRVQVVGCRATVCSVRGEAPGYARAVLDDVVVPNVAEIVLVLAGRARVTGRCMFRGEPVENFDLFVMQDEGNAVQHERLRDRPDGRFELDQVAAGNLVLVAASDASAESEPLSVEAKTGADVDVTLELREPLVGRGTVVDAVTGEPISNAFVRACVSYRTWVVGQKGVDRPVDSRGRFELALFPAGESSLLVGAPGYESTFFTASSGADGTLDFGLLPISGRQSLEVRLVASEPFDASSFWFRGEGPSNIDFVRFPPDGKLRFEDVAPGLYALYVVWPNGESLSSTPRFVAGRTWEYVVPVEPGEPLRVEVVSDDGGSLPAPLGLNIEFPDERGESISRNVLVPESGIVDVFHLRGDHATVEVVPTDHSTCYGVAHVNLAPGNERHVRIPISHRTLHVSVVDAEGKPLPGTWVSLVRPIGESGWTTRADADAEGVARFPGLGVEPVFVHADHPVHGSRSHVPVEIEPEGDTFAEIVLDELHDLHVRALDGSEALPGVTVRFHPPHSDQFFSVRTTNHQGVATCANVSAGSYCLRVDDPGIWPTSVTIRFEGGDDPIMVQARRLGGAELVVRSKEGLPIAGAPVSLTSTEFGEDVSTWIGRRLVTEPPRGLATGADGTWRIDGIPRGEYRVRVLLPEGKQLASTLIVPPRAIAQVELRAD